MRLLKVAALFDPKKLRVLELSNCRSTEFRVKRSNYACRAKMVFGMKPMSEFAHTRMGRRVLTGATADRSPRGRISPADLLQATAHLLAMELPR